MTETTTKQTKIATSEQAAAVPRKQAESPRAFYERLTNREDIRRLLAKLAKL